MVLISGDNVSVAGIVPLAQVRPLTTDPIVAYTPARKGLKGLIRNIVVCNTLDRDAVYSLFHDFKGTRFDDFTAHFSRCPIRARGTNVIRSDDREGWPVLFNGNWGVSSLDAPGCTFTIYGDEVEV